MRRDDPNWRHIEGYEGLYMVSRDGVVMRQDFNGEWVEKKPSISKTGYLRTHLYRDGNKKTVFVHHLVICSFKGDRRQDGLICNHKNGIKTDNRIENLEWVTYSENSRHAIETGLYKYKFKGDNHYNSKLTSKEVVDIRDKYNSGRMSTTELAANYGVSLSTICDIAKRRTWAHLE